MALHISINFMSQGLGLTYLRKDCRESIFTTAKVILKSYDRFNVGEALKHITLRELIPFEGSGQRVKLFIAKLFGKYIYALSLTAYGFIRRYIL